MKSGFKQYQSVNAADDYEGDFRESSVWSERKGLADISPVEINAFKRYSLPKGKLEFVVAFVVIVGMFAFSTTYGIGYSTVKRGPSFPNIVFILTDDQGVGDMDIAGSDFEGLMPTIRALSTAGINLTNYYSASLCSPARSALLTGKYPINNGMQHGVITGVKVWGLPSTEVLLPQYLSTIGYNSHLVGKWHLGHYSSNQVPTSRGFDTFFGYYGGYQHPTEFLYEWPVCVNQSGCVSDMMSGDTPILSDGETFNTHLFVSEAEKIIQFQEPGRPFFLYLSLPLMHMPVIADPDILTEYEDELSHIDNSWRRTTAGMAIMLDKAVERVINALVEAKHLPNTIIIFASDNGAQVEGSLYGAGSNFPLRGAKGSLYEGGSKVPAFIFSPLFGHVLPLKTYDSDVSEDVDTSTVVEADDHAGDDGNSAATEKDDDAASDKENDSAHFNSQGDDYDDGEPDLSSRRLRVATNEVTKASTRRKSASAPQHRRRLLTQYNITDIGSQANGLFHVTDWVPTILAAVGRLDIIEGKPLDGINQWEYLLELSTKGNNEGMIAPRSEFLYNADPMSGIAALRRNEWKLLLNESEYASWFNGNSFGNDYCGLEPSQSVQLYNLTADPEERMNLADSNSDIVDEMRDALMEYYRTAAPVEYCSYGDSKALDRWIDVGYVCPWMDSDFSCPVANSIAGWCTLIDPNQDMDEPSSGQMGVPTV